MSHGVRLSSEVYVDRFGSKQSRIKRFAHEKSRRESTESLILSFESHQTYIILMIGLSVGIHSCIVDQSRSSHIDSW